MTDKRTIGDTNRIMIREINGCHVRLFFSSTHNERVEQIILDNLMLVFDRRVQSFNMQHE